MKKKGIQTRWTLQEVSEGMELFSKEFSRYPSTLDFDKVDFLPSSRFIQRKFGGIVKLRSLLNLDTPVDYTKGEYRSSVAKDIYTNAIVYEDLFYSYLVSKIPEIRVHEHKILRPGRVCCDFFIYTSIDKGIAVDLFYAQDIFSLARIITIKQKRYTQLIRIPVYLVLINNYDLTQEEIDDLMYNKKIQLADHIKVITEKNFKEKILDEHLADRAGNSF